MALVDCKFFSESLGMSSSVLVLLPERSPRGAGPAGPGASAREHHPTLFLLHGMGDDETIWLRLTSIERYVESLGLAVVMPNVHRSFYVNMKHGLRYWDYVSDELVAKVREFFPLSPRRESTYVAGLSMGGYGAMLLGLRKPEQYAAVAALSGVCDVELFRDRAKQEFENIFGADSVRGTDRDLFFLAERLAASEGPKPELFMCCGTSDFLYPENVKFHEHLGRLGLEHTYLEGPAGHEWSYWDSAIQRVLAWLPLPGRPSPGAPTTR